MDLLHRQGLLTCFNIMFQNSFIGIAYMCTSSMVSLRMCVIYLYVYMYGYGYMFVYVYV